MYKRTSISSLRHVTPLKRRQKALQLGYVVPKPALLVLADPTQTAFIYLSARSPVTDIFQDMCYWFLKRYKFGWRRKPYVWMFSTCSRGCTRSEILIITFLGWTLMMGNHSPVKVGPPVSLQSIKCEASQNSYKQHYMSHTNKRKNNSCLWLM